MSTFDKMNMETQLEVAYSTIAELRDQIDVLSRTVWSLEERLRMEGASREELKVFYERQMEKQRAEQQRMIDAAVSEITSTFEGRLSKVIAERDAALLDARLGRGKRFGRKSERNAGRRDDGGASGTRGLP